MRKLWSRFGLGIVAVFAATMVYAAANQAPEKSTIDDCVTKRAAVEFPHKAHVDLKIACSTCHHTQENLTAESTEAVPTCGSCHSTPEKPETPICTQMSATKNPFHISCMGCHKEEAKKNPATKAPTKCDDCHPKAKA